MPLRERLNLTSQGDRQNPTLRETKLTPEAEKEVLRVLAQWVVDFLLEQNREGGSR